MYGFEDYELGRSDDELQISTRDENLLAVTMMAKQCQNSIDIISRDLEPAIFDIIDVVEAIKKLVLNNKHARVRVLIFEPKKIVQGGHRLVDLGMNLSSYIEFRVPGNEYKDFNEFLFIVDTTAYVHRLNSERYEATVNFNNRRVSKHLREAFDDIWEKSTVDSNFRKMHI